MEKVSVLAITKNGINIGLRLKEYFPTWEIFAPSKFSDSNKEIIWYSESTTEKIVELFKNNKCVNNVYSFSEKINENSYKEIFNTFLGVGGKKNEYGVEKKHNTIDIRQFHAVNLGFMLTKDEMSMISSSVTCNVDLGIRAGRTFTLPATFQSVFFAAA